MPGLSTPAQVSTYGTRADFGAPSRARPEIACWRPVSAVAAVLVGLIAGQGLALGLLEAAGDGRGLIALGLLVGDLILLACVVAAAAREADRLGPVTFGIRRPQWGPAVGWGATLLVAGIAVDGLLSLLFGSDGGGDSSTTHFSPGTAMLITVGVAVTAPLAEEIAFRGYLFPALARWRGPWIAATVTAVLFGAAHVAALPPELLPGAAFFGFGACLLFWFTGSVVPGVIVHSLNNALVLTFVTGGELAPALLGAPLICLLVLLPLARERAPASAQS